MSDTAAAGAAHAAHGHHEELGFLRTYVFSTDHKMIGRQFLFLGLFMLLIGGLLAMMMRWQLAWPETAVPGLNFIPEPYMYGGIIPPNTYNALFTMHATIMIFFVVMPIMVGSFGNFFIPLMIGSRGGMRLLRVLADSTFYRFSAYVLSRCVRPCCGLARPSCGAGPACDHLR